MDWKGGTRAGALAGQLGGFALWVYTLMLPSIAKSGWWQSDFVERGLFDSPLLKPESLFGMSGLDNLTHSLFWSLLVNVALYVAVPLLRRPSAAETSQALLFVDVFHRGGADGVRHDSPVFWRGHARIEDLRALVGHFLGEARAHALFDG
jgi:Na+/proline symporter